MANLFEEWKNANATVGELEAKIAKRIGEIQVLLHTLYEEPPAANWYYPSHDCNMDYPCEVGLNEAVSHGENCENYAISISWFDEAYNSIDGVEIYPRYLNMTDEEIIAEWNAQNAKALEEEQKRREKELKKKAAKEKKDKATLNAIKKKLTKEELKVLNLK